LAFMPLRGNDKVAFYHLSCGISHVDCEHCAKEEIRRGLSIMLRAWPQIITITQTHLFAVIILRATVFATEHACSVCIPVFTDAPVAQPLFS